MAGWAQREDERADAQARAERIAALTACLRELVEAHEVLMAGDALGPGAGDLRAAERLEAALAQARALLEGRPQ